uniref:hypothetical protein n=1 Tax=Flavobacterium sp. TaxID=239 RepID=UPI004049D08C
MDELEILKRDWKKNENSFNQITEKEIYGMLHKKSSSIVKWILVISILEILFWIILGLFSVDESYLKTLKIYHLDIIIPIASAISYAVVLFFIYLFYKNYKAINTKDTVKQLMRSILKTRKTVQLYVWYNIFMSFLAILVVFICQIKYDPNLSSIIENSSESVTENTIYILIFIVYLLVALLISGLIWLFYRLLYGVLLKRLYKNYKELEKLDL